MSKTQTQMGGDLTAITEATVRRQTKGYDAEMLRSSLNGAKRNLVLMKEEYEALKEGKIPSYPHSKRAYNAYVNPRLDIKSPTLRKRMEHGYEIDILNTTERIPVYEKLIQEAEN